jgi:hypothetical protein
MLGMISSFLFSERLIKVSDVIVGPILFGDNDQIAVIVRERPLLPAFGASPGQTIGTGEAGKVGRG